MKIIKFKVLTHVNHFKALRWLLLAIYSLSSTAMAEAERPKIVFGYIEFAPYYFTNDQGMPEGPFIDLARALTDEVGLEPEFISMPTKRALLARRNGEMQMWFGLPTTPLYKDRAFFSEKPIMKLELSVFSKNSMENFQGVEDLFGKSVVVIRGFTYGKLLEKLEKSSPSTKLIRVSDHAQGLEVLDTRNIDYLIGYTALLDEGMKEYPIKNLKKVVIQTLHPHIAIHKNYPNAGWLMDRLEVAFQKIRASEILEIGE